MDLPPPPFDEKKTLPPNDLSFSKLKFPPSIRVRGHHRLSYCKTKLWVYFEYCKISLGCKKNETSHVW